jgi:hypothetical protein
VKWRKWREEAFRAPPEDLARRESAMLTRLETDPVQKEYPTEGRWVQKIKIWRIK